MLTVVKITIIYYFEINLNIIVVNKTVGNMTILNVQNQIQSSDNNHKVPIKNSVSIQNDNSLLKYNNLVEKVNEKVNIIIDSLPITQKNELNLINM